jgi:Holliday junction resolvase RusA-like endonuclease
VKDSTKTPLVIKGHPQILKNSKTIMKAPNGKRFIGKPKVSQKMKSVILELSSQWRGKPLDFPVSLRILSMGAWRRASGNIPDASNLYEFPQDALQRAGILLDDRLVEHHDGSRRIPLCDNCESRPIIKRGPRKGQAKETCGKVKSCPFEKVEIFITDERGDEGP